MSMEWRGGGHIVPPDFRDDHLPEVEERDLPCPVCGGDGVVDDAGLLCHNCDGEGYQWWLS